MNGTPGKKPKLSDYVKKHGLNELTGFGFYTFYPILDYLPLSELEKRVFSLVLTVAKNKDGLTMSNDNIGKVINRSGSTVKNTLNALRKKGLIAAGGKSPKRYLFPSDNAAELIGLAGQVNKAVLDNFLKLLAFYTSPLLDNQDGESNSNNHKQNNNLHPKNKNYELSTNIIKEYKSAPSGLRQSKTAAAGQVKKPPTRQQQIAEEQRLKETEDQSKTVIERSGKSFKEVLAEKQNRPPPR